MAGFTQDMVDVVENAELAFVATVRRDGRPNRSSIGSVRVLDPENLIFADMASPQTVEYLRNRPDVEVNVELLSPTYTVGHARVRPPVCTGQEVRPEFKAVNVLVRAHRGGTPAGSVAESNGAPCPGHVS
jgi:hypothetical protein